MRDYENVEQQLDKIIGTGTKYFNTLNFPRNALSFVPNKKGSSVRYGEKGNWIIPHLGALQSGALRKAAATNDWFTVGDTIETPFYCAKLNPDGSFASLFDKQLHREWTDGDFNKLRIYDDRPGNYDAWDILPNYTDKQLEVKVSEPLHLAYADGECAEFVCSLQTEKSTWNMHIRFFRQDRGIEVENNIDWHESHKLAKAEFSCNILTRKALCDTSAGFIERSTHRNTTWQQARYECCHHKWVDLSETDGGIALLNDGKYGVSLYQNTMGLSLLRATERPDVTSDLGQHSFCYKILPHSGDAVTAEINKLALQYNIPLVKADVQWNLPDFAPLFLQAVKESEDKSMTVLRLSEQDGRRGTIKLPMQVKVLNMLEEVQGEADTLAFKPFEFLTIGIKK